MYVCSNCLEKEATYTDMAGKYEWCESCLPRGCSCNDENVSYYKNEGEEDNIEELKEQFEKFKTKIINGNYKLKDYGEKIHCSGKEKRIIQNKEEIKKIMDNVKETEMLNFVAIPLDKENREYPCCEIEPKEDFSILKVNEVVFSPRLNIFLIIKEEYKNSFKAHEITNDISKYITEYNSIEEDEIKNLEIDYCNTHYISKDGVEYNKSEIDLYLTTYNYFNEESYNLKKFLQENIFCNEEVKYLEDEKNIFNNDMGYYFGYYEEYRQSKKEKKDFYYGNEIIRKNENKIKTYLYKSFQHNERRELRKLNKKEVNKLFNLLVIFHKVDEKVKYLDVLNPTVHIGCDCGCGGDLIDEGDYEYADKLINKRKSVFKKIIHLIY